MKSNQLNVIAIMLLATAGISANNTNNDAVQKALDKANEIVKTGKGSLTKEESALLAAAGFSYTQVTETVPATQNTVQQVPAKTTDSTKHGLFVANLLCQLFDKLLS